MTSTEELIARWRDARERARGSVAQTDLVNLAAAENQLLPRLIEEREWRTMESAPKDGTRVLLFVPPYGPSTGHYAPARTNWGPKASLWVAHSVLNKVAAPTHWMPLPQPPKET